MYHSSPQPSFNPSQSEASILIEELVQAIEQTEEPAFYLAQSPTEHEHLEPSSLSGLFCNVQQLIDIYYSNSEQYDYTEQLHVFWKAYQDVGLECSLEGPVCLDATGSRYLSFHQSMNTLADRIRHLTREQAYRRKASDRSYQTKKKIEDLECYVRSVLQRYSRTVVVRVDLHYLDMVKPRLRIQHLYKDLEKLIRAHERNPIFKHTTGYIWSVEQGKDKGFHVHTAFFFNGAHVRNDWHKAVEIGELWKQITSSHGYAYRCNDDKKKYVKLGIGTINRADTLTCNNVVEAMSYLAKDSQPPRIKPAGRRTFGTGFCERSGTTSTL